MVYLLGILALSYRQGTGPSVLASFLSMLAFDFFFVPPRFTFAVADIHYLFMFFVMLLVGLSISSLAAQVRRQSEKNQQVQMQIETERLRSSLLSSISHDLRTPLAAITGSTSSLLEDGEALDPATRRDLLENIYEESERLGHLVTNLLEMTKLEAGSVPLHREMHHMGEIIGSAISRLEKKIQSHTLATQIPPDLPLVPMDGLLMEQVLINLLENALKYTPEKTPIHLSAWTEGGNLGVRVADQGPGLPPEDVSHLFEKFYRGAQKNKKGGAGLGLAICKGIVQIHGGTIRALNQTTGGAAFEFYLPLKIAEQKVQ
jgi:two-component system sensor histidine kinase KdpD